METSAHFTLEQQISEPTIHYLRRQLYQSYENDTGYDTSDESNDDDYMIASLTSASIYFAVFGFWNTICASTIVIPAIIGIRNKEYGLLVPLLCPHWIAGIWLPASMGYSFAGFLGLFLGVLVCVIFPYTVAAFCICKKASQLTQDNSDETSTPEAVTSPQETPDGNPQTLTGSARKSYLQSALKLSKIVAGSIRGFSNINHQPKTDITIPNKGADDNDDEGESTSSSISNTSTSDDGDLICAICLEPYELNETICWSHNPSCRHAFHRSCAVEWLMDKTECPICRRPYIGPGATR
jgi:hypothetical protein